MLNPIEKFKGRHSTSEYGLESLILLSECRECQCQLVAFARYSVFWPPYYGYIAYDAWTILGIKSSFLIENTIII